MAFRQALQSSIRFGRHVGLRGTAIALARAPFGSLTQTYTAPASRQAATALAFIAAGTTLWATSCVALAASPQEQSFIMLKPDAVQRGLVADIIKRFEAKGYKLVGIKILVPPEELAKEHYAEHDGKPFYPGLVKFLSSGPVVAMVWEGKEVVKYGRMMIGATNPIASAPGTIRGDYGIEVGRNIIHGSDSPESAQKEIALWFNSAEVADYDLTLKPWIYEK